MDESITKAMRVPAFFKERAHTRYTPYLSYALLHNVTFKKWLYANLDKKKCDTVVRIKVPTHFDEQLRELSHFVGLSFNDTIRKAIEFAILKIDPDPLTVAPKPKPKPAPERIEVYPDLADTPATVVPMPVKPTPVKPVPIKPSLKSAPGSEHLIFGGSTATRTMNCSPWAYYSQDIPNSTGEHAIRGTALHEVAEVMVKEGIGPSDAVDEYKGDYAVTPDDIAALEDVDDALFELEGDLPADFIWQTEVKSILIENVAGGTADLFGYDEASKTGYLLDHKFGFVEVSPDDLQLKTYAYALAPAGVENWVLGVIQPAVHQGRPNVITISHEELKEDVTAYLKQVDKGRRGEGELKVGPWCKYCPAATKTCPKVRESAEKIKTYPIEEQVRLAESLRPIISRILEDAKLALESGKPVEGYKLVEGRRSRKWASSDDATDFLERTLGDKAYERKLLSPAKAEKVLKGNDNAARLNALIVSTPGNPTMVEESDKREAVSVTLSKNTINMMKEIKL